MATEKYLGDGVVTGYGQIDGRTVYIYAQDFTVYGGTLGEMQSHKICRVMDLAVRNGAPIIGLIDSGGARIQEGVKSLGGYAEIFRRNAQYSGVIPQISVMLGPCAGGAAYSPALTDLIIMVEKHSFMFLTGPEVIKAVTGEIVDAESLGGAEVHMTVTGTAHLSTAPLSRKPWSWPAGCWATCPPTTSKIRLICPRPTTRCAWTKSSTTSSRWIHLRCPTACTRSSSTWWTTAHSWRCSRSGPCNAIIGLARIGGHSVGIVAQEPSVMAGVIDIDASDKIARFVRMCDCFNIPLVTFVDSPGFLPGSDQEHGGIIRHGAKVLYAYSEATVPKITVITRKAYGGAYVVMSSKYLGTDVTYAWPSAEIAVMGAEGAVKSSSSRSKALPTRLPSARRLVEEYRERFNNPYFAPAPAISTTSSSPGKPAPKIIASLAALRDKHVRCPAAQTRQHPGVTGSALDDILI